VGSRPNGKWISCAPARTSASRLSSFAGGERGVRPEVAHRALDAGAAPGPRLLGGIARAHEQHETGLVVPRPQHDHRPGLLEPGQIKDVAVLPELVVRVAVAELFGRGREHQRRVGPDPAHQLGAALGIWGRRGGAGNR
jgi:hypothetical protein